MSLDDKPISAFVKIETIIEPVCYQQLLMCISLLCVNEMVLIRLQKSGTIIIGRNEHLLIYKKLII